MALLSKVRLLVLISYSLLLFAISLASSEYPDVTQHSYSGSDANTHESSTSSASYPDPQADGPNQRGYEAVRQDGKQKITTGQSKLDKDARYWIQERLRQNEEDEVNDWRSNQFPRGNVAFAEDLTDFQARLQLTPDIVPLNQGSRSQTRSAARPAIVEPPRLLREVDEYLVQRPADQSRRHNRKRIFDLDLEQP